jgi:L-ascorbate metabolism protein UlaG (beta-lactamase superfamily)
MLLAHGAALDLNLERPAMSLPFSQLLRAFLEAKFDASACRAAVERLLPAAQQKLVNLGAFKRGGVILRPEVLYPDATSWIFTVRRGADSLSFRLPGSARSVATLIRDLTDDDQPVSPKAIARQLPTVASKLLLGARRRRKTWSAPQAPGIYRREHACLLIQSERAAVLVDPVWLMPTFAAMRSDALRPRVTKPHAVLITHTHGDHFHLPSLLSVVSPATRLVVPEVPRASLLTDGVPIETTKKVGLRAEAAAWGKTLVIGDVEVDVLPFYGEQPFRDPPGLGRDLRNWGNCYRVTTPHFSALILVDSGADPKGDMEDVVADSVRRRGPVDIVLACMREFDSPFFGGLSSYWGPVPFARLQALYRSQQKGRLPSTTAGPGGAARLCAIAKAKYFLPYANGFDGHGTEVADIGWGYREPSEPSQRRRMARELKRIGATTKVVPWVHGDAMLVGSRGLKLERQV